MRVNVDSQVVTDPRFKKLGRALGMAWHEALGRAYVVWLESYQRRLTTLSLEDVDALAERDGFGLAMVRAELATRMGDDMIRIRGVEQRIEFLLEQKARSVRGVEARTRSKSVSDQSYVSGAEHQTERRIESVPNGQPLGQPNGPPNGKPDDPPNGKPKGRPIGEPFGQPSSLSPDLDLTERIEREPWRDLGSPRASETPPALRASLSQIPSGFSPDFGDPESARIVDSARARGVNVEREIEKFRQHCKSKSLLRTDWNAACLEWIIRANPDLNGKAVAPVPEPSRRQASGTPPPRITRSADDTAELRMLAQQAISSLSDARSVTPVAPVVLDRERFDDSDCQEPGADSDE